MPGSILDQAYEEKRNAELDAELDDLEADYRRRNPPPEPPKPTAPAAGSEQQPKAPVSPGNGGLEKILAADDRRAKKKQKPYGEGDQFSSLMQGDFGDYYDKSQISREINRLLAERQANGSAVTREDLITLAESNYAQRQAMVAQVQKDIPGLAKSGLAAGASGLMSATGMFAEIVGDEEQAAELYDAARGVEQISKDAVETPENPELAGIYDGLRSFAMAAPAATIAWKTKRPEVMLDFMFGAAAGSANLDAQDPILTAEATDTTPEEFKTLTLGERLTYSVASGLAERLMETLPAHKLYGSAPGKSIVKRFFESLATEIPGEQGTLAAQKFLEWRTLNPTVPVERYYAEYPQEAYRTFVATIVGTVLNNAGVLALDTAEQSLGKGLEALQKPAADGEPDGGAPAPDAAPDAEGATPEPEAPAAAEPEAPAADGEAAPKITIAELADQANEVVEQLAEQFKEPETESPDQKFVRGVESALGIKRPPAPVETPEERRARMAERDAAEQRTLQDSTQRIVSAVRSFAETRAAAEQTVERAIEAPAPETVIAAVAAQNELAEQTDAEPISLAEAMDVDITDRTSTLAEAERMAAELEAMDSEDAKSAGSTFRTLIQYSEKYDDNTFWQGFDEALELAAPHLMTEAQQAAVIEKVAEAVEAAPLPPEDDASATLVEEVRATAPASRYFGRKSFGGEGLATETPAAAAAPEAAPVARTSAKYQVETEDAGSFELTIIRLPDGSVGLIGPDINVNYVPAFAKGKTDQELMAYQFEPLGFKQATDKAGRGAEPPAAAPQPARLPPKPAPISDTQLAAISAKEGKLSRPVQAREAMLLKAESVYDDILTKEVLEELDDRHDMNVRQVREVMGKAIEGQGSLDRFNTLMKRYAAIRADLDRQAAESGVQADFEALAASQPDPGEGGLGRGLGSLMAEQGVNPETKFSGAGASKRKPVKDAEKNRKRLDARAYRDWGQNYLDLVQKGIVSYASAEEISAAGLGSGGERAYYLKHSDGTHEVIINSSQTRPEHMEGILLHEVGWHAGLEGLVGPVRKEEILRQIDRLVSSFEQKQQNKLPTTRAEQAAYSARHHAIRNSAQPEHVREETGAYIAEHHVGNPLFFPFITQIKVALGRRFPGIIDRLGWGSAEYAQLALVSLRRFIIKEIKHVPNDRAMPGYRSPRAPFMLQVTYPEGFRKLAKSQGSATTPQGWARRTMAMGQMQMWRMIRTLDLRNVDAFPQQLKDMERDLTSPEVFEAFFGMDPNFEWENYLDLLYLSQQGDPAAAFDLTEILTQLKGLDVPVEVKFSADGIVNDLPGSALWEASRAKGLDMSAEARRARGTAAGFNMEETLYHGTGADFTVFDLDRSGDSAGTPGERAVFLSANPTEASVYARNAAVANNGPGAFGQGANIRGANVMPMVIRPGRQMVVTTQSHPELKSQDGKVMLYNATRFAEIIADARAQGYNTVRFENVLDSALDPADQIAVLNPKDIRSINAAFDPKNTNSENVMFSRGEAGTGRPGRFRFQGKAFQPFSSKVKAEIIRTSGGTVDAENIDDLISTYVEDLIDSTPQEIVQTLRQQNTIPGEIGLTSKDVEYLAFAELMAASLTPMRPDVMFSADFADPAPPMDPVMEEAYSKFFNFMRNGLPPDNQGRSFILAAMNDPEVLARKGQRITLAETRMKASNADAVDALLRSRKGDRLSEDEVLAIRDFHETSLQHMLEVAAELVDRPSDAVTLAAYQMAVKVHQVVLAEAQNQMAAASRIMNSGRIVAQTNAGVAAALRVDLNDPTAAGRLVQLASEMTRLDPTRSGHIRKINRAVEISTWDAWKQLGAATIRFMFLSWPPTHFVNALGNTLVMIGGISDHYIAGLKPGQQDLMEEAAIRWTAMLQAMKHQVEYMDANSQFNPLKPNFSLQFDPVEVSGTNKWGEDQARALSAERIGKLTGGLYKPTSDDPIGAFADFLGYGLSAPSDALGVADDLFKGVNYTIALHGLAFREAREARRAGKITEQQEREHAQKLIEFPPDHIVKGAIAEAQENTFTRPVGQITQLALKGRGMADNLAMFGTLKMPFIITPSNLFSFQFRRMPTGPLFPEWRRNYAAGGKKRALAEAQFAMGSMMLMAGWAALSMGLLTGAGPEDPEKRKALMDTGWQPFAAQFGREYVQTNRLDPTMMPFHIGALFAETAANDGWNAKPDADWHELWGLSAIKFGQMMLDKSYLSGVASFIEALGSDGNAAERLGRDYQNSLVSATTPAFLAGIRRIEDPHKRLVDDVFSKYRNRIPVLSNEVPPAYDVFGAPVTYQTGLARVAQVVNPFAVSSIKDGAVYDEIERLKYIPSIMDKSISFPWAGKTYDIPLDERMDIYSEMTGAFGGNEELGIPNFRDRLNTMLESDDYKALSDINDPRIEGSKAKFISDYVENARTVIKKRIRFKHHDFLKTEAMKQLGGQTELARGKEAEATESAVTQAYEQLLQDAK